MGNSIAFIVPVYKTSEEQLTCCVEHLVNQTYKDIEIILIDDCSPDRCGVLCDEFASSDPRIKVIHLEKNSGVSHARNVGVENVSAKWFTFVDADDWLDYSFCEVINSYLDRWNRNPNIIFFKNYRNYGNSQCEYRPVFDNESWFFGSQIGDFQIKALSFVSKLYPKNAHGLDYVCGKLYSSVFIRDKSIRFKNLKSREDCLFFLDSTSKADCIVYIDESLYHYRFNPDSVANGYRPNGAEEQITFLNLLWEFVDRKNSDSFIKAYYYEALLCFVSVLKNHLFNKCNNSSYFQKRKRCKKLLKNEPFKGITKNLRIKELRAGYGLSLLFIRAHLYYLIILMIKAYAFLQKRKAKK